MITIYSREIFKTWSHEKVYVRKIYEYWSSAQGNVHEKQKFRSAAEPRKILSAKASTFKVTNSYCRQQINCWHYYQLMALIILVYYYIELACNWPIENNNNNNNNDDNNNCFD